MVSVHILGLLQAMHDLARHTHSTFAFCPDGERPITISVVLVGFKQVSGMSFPVAWQRPMIVVPDSRTHEVGHDDGPTFISDSAVGSQTETKSAFKLLQ